MYCNDFQRSSLDYVVLPRASRGGQSHCPLRSAVASFIDSEPDALSSNSLWTT